MEEFNALPFTTRRPYVNTQPQKADLEEEVKRTLAQLPLLKERLEHLDRQIAFYGDVDSVQIDLGSDPTGHRNQMAMHKLMKAELQSERVWLLTKVEKTIKRPKL